MEKIKSENHINVIKDIEGRLILIGAMLEIVRDSCLQHDYTNQEMVLETVLNNYSEVLERLSLMY